MGVGVIGLGRIGAFHAESLRNRVAGARLVAAAVAPPDRERLLAVGAAPCALVDDVDALLATPGVDAIVVASPSSLHHEHILRVAAAGKPLFSEKPIADSVAQARDAVAAVRRAGVPFQIGFQRRFDPAYIRAREYIAAGSIGTVEMFRGITCDRIPPVEFLRTSGGLFWDLAIHDFDAARFLTGDEIAEVHAVGSIEVEPRLAEFDDVDYGIVTLRFASGALGVCQASWRAPYGYDIRAEVHGSLGKVVAEVDEKIPTRLYRDGGMHVERHDQFTERFREAYTAELQAFVDALQTGRAPSPDAADALRSVEISDAATRSRREGRWVRVGE
ncbi:MAG: inositol 2-dehydrogenase [Thermomicrobiales bacterium]|nr:inositol 2-dehydrogenase [Thermomicrobiales bacterium]